jgi:hypothetical protein
MCIWDRAVDLRLRAHATPSARADHTRLGLDRGTDPRGACRVPVRFVHGLGTLGPAGDME